MMLLQYILIPLHMSHIHLQSMVLILNMDLVGMQYCGILNSMVQVSDIFQSNYYQLVLKGIDNLGKLNFHLNQSGITVSD
jgi:hypothetical protein